MNKGPHTVHTMGYTGRTVEDIANAAKALRAIVVDIRYSPRSKAGCWNGPALRSRLEMLGVDYVWMPEFGNVNYKTPARPIMLKDPNAGCKKLRKLTENGSAVILLCACPKASECHRTRVAEGMARRFGSKIRHQDIAIQDRSTKVEDDRQAPLF